MLPIFTKPSRGMTLVEVMVTVFITVIVLTFVYVTLDGFYNANIRIAGISTQTMQLKVALHQIETDLIKTNGLLASAPVSQPPLGPNNNNTPWQWNDPLSPFHQALISRIPITTGGANDQNRQLVIDKASVDACTGGQSTFLTANYVYFVRQSTLYRRIIPPAVSEACGSVASFDQKQSCAAEFTASYAICQSSDARLLDNVTGFHIAYYNSISDSTPFTPTEENSDSTISHAKAVVITLQTTRHFNGRINQDSAAVRINVTRKN